MAWGSLLSVLQVAGGRGWSQRLGGPLKYIVKAFGNISIAVSLTGKVSNNANAPNIYAYTEIHVENKP